MSWSPSNPPRRGGSYSRFIAVRQATLPASTRGTVAIPITHDWGPLKQFVRVGSIEQFVDVYGQGGDPSTFTYTPGFLAVYNAFKGEGDDDPGAGTVVVYRTGGTGVLKASKTLSNTTPAVAITVNAIYEGVRGNSLRVAVEANAADSATKNDLVVYDGTLEVERWAHLKTDMNALAAAVNAKSDWIRVSVTVSGVALATVAASSLTGGNDGSTLVAQDWTDLMAAFETQRFDVFAPYNLTDSSITTSLITWTKAKNSAERAKRFMLVVGGLGAETMANALTRASGANWEDVVTLGVGTYKDSALNITQSTAQLAPRAAGVIGARGFGASISFAHLQDLSVVTGPTDTEILNAIDGGVVVLAQDSAGVRFEAGVTTYTSDPDDKPKDVYGVIKYVYTMEDFERTLQFRHESGNMLGRLNVNDDTREFLVGDGQALLNDKYIKEGAVQPGAKVVVAQNPPPDDDQNFIALDWVASFARSLEQVRNTFYLS